MCNTGEIDDCIHLLFRCPVTKIADTKLNEWEWNEECYYEKLSTVEEWEIVILQPLNTRDIMLSEAETVTI